VSAGIGLLLLIGDRVVVLNAENCRFVMLPEKPAHVMVLRSLTLSPDGADVVILDNLSTHDTPEVRAVVLADLAFRSANTGKRPRAARRRWQTTTDTGAGQVALMLEAVQDVVDLPGPAPRVRGSVDGGVEDGTAEAVLVMEEVVGRFRLDVPHLEVYGRVLERVRIAVDLPASAGWRRRSRTTRRRPRRPAGDERPCPDGEGR
jgi:hypothetical protein